MLRIHITCYIFVTFIKILTQKLFTLTGGFIWFKLQHCRLKLLDLMKAFAQPHHSTKFQPANPMTRGNLILCGRSPLFILPNCFSLAQLSLTTFLPSPNKSLIPPISPKYVHTVFQGLNP